MAMKEVTQFSDVMTQAINNNILTYEAMKESSLYVTYWVACHDLAKALVRANYSMTEKARNLMSWDFEDVVSEFSIHLERKFEAQIKAIENSITDINGSLKKHNYSGYNTTMLTNFLNDKIDKYAIKGIEEYIDENNKKHHKTVNLKKVDENGVASNLYWDFDSMSRSISDDGSLTLGDTLVSDTYNPETTTITKFDEIDAKKESFEHLKKLCKMKTYLGCVYVYIEDILSQNNIPCSLESQLEIFNDIEKKSAAEQEAAQKAFIKAYNNDLVSFIYYVCENEIDDEATNFIYSNYAKSFNDFGRNFRIDEDTIYHRRDEYRKTIAKIMGIEIPKKFKK